MNNMIEAAKSQIHSLVTAAYERCARMGTLPAGAVLDGTLEIPKDPAFGDYACGYAMAAARVLHQAPRKIAEAIAAQLDLEGSYFAEATVAGAGFLNFRLNSRWQQAVLAAIEQDGPDYGRSRDGISPDGTPRKVMVEFVSANPTGPMHIGNARGGVLGDSLAAVLDWDGFAAWREFYVNDAGNQIDLFSRSIDARYRQLVYGEEAVPFPEEGYHGDDIRALAQGIYDAHGDSWMAKPEPERLAAMAEYGLGVNIPKMRADLERYHIHYDRWFLESELHKSGYVDETVALLEEKGLTYEKDGALWLKTSRLLREKYLAEGKTEKQLEKLELKDDVLRRANGFYTYFAVDIAYHRDKFARRGFDKVINVWGADHHGHVARLQAALDGLGLDGSHRLVIVLMQLVNLLQDGQPVRMSKRTGKAIALANLLDEISVDAARYFFNSRSSETQMDFDLSLAVRQDSENPVYYVQYAHARICSLIANLTSDGAVLLPAEEIDASLLTHETERALIKQLALLPEEIRAAAAQYDPSRINRYVYELAGRFHRFYNACRIRGEEPALLEARMKLADATRSVIAVCLRLLGVTAPEKM